MADKFVMVPNDVWVKQQQIQEQQRKPEITLSSTFKSLLSIEDDIRKLLESSGLTDYDKAKLLSDLQRRYGALYASITAKQATQLPSSIPTIPKTPYVISADPASDEEDSTVTTLPKSKRRRYEPFYDPELLAYKHKLRSFKQARRRNTDFTTLPLSFHSILDQLPSASRQKSLAILENLSRGGVINWDSVGQVRRGAKQLVGSNIVDILRHATKRKPSKSGPEGWDEVVDHVRSSSTFAPTLPPRMNWTEQGSSKSSPLTPKSDIAGRFSES